MSPFRKVLFVVAIVAVSTTMISLGRWQLRRLAGRRASNAVLQAAADQPPLQLPSQLAANRMVDSGRRVAARGHFDPADQLLLRDHVQNDGPGLQVVTPFVLDGSDVTLWVLRGFVPSPDAVTPPTTILAPDSGVVTIHGLALALPVTNDSGAPLHHDGTTTWRRLDRDVLALHRPGSLAIYLLLADDSNGRSELPVAPPPVLDNGPHLSYAIQWFGMALAVLTFGVIVLWRDGRGVAAPLQAP